MQPKLRFFPPHRKIFRYVYKAENFSKICVVKKGLKVLVSEAFGDLHGNVYPQAREQGTEESSPGSVLFTA